MRSIRNVALVVGALFVSSTAFAQTSLDETQTGGSNADLTINLSLTLESAITLTLSGNTPSDPATALTDIDNPVGEATVQFGTVNTTCSSNPSTGQCYTLTDNSGARLIATIDATATISGFASYDLGIQGADVGGINAQLYKDCGADGSCPNVASENFWEVPANGVLLPGTTGSAAYAGNELGAAQISGSVQEHQLALEIANSQGPGALTAAVLYTATPNP